MTLGPGLAVGLGTTLAMWGAGYVTHVPGIAPDSLAGKAVVGVILLIIMATGLALSGVSTGVGRGWRVGLVAGAVCGGLNLMVLGSLLSEPPVEGGSSVAPGAGLAAAGFLATSVVLGGVMGAAGGVTLRGRLNLIADATRWRFRIFTLAAIGVVPVLLTGGLVTSHNAGLAVPDWPNSYTANMFLYPLSKMTGGIYYEHTHRLFGTLAGMGCVVAFAYAMVVWLRRVPCEAPRRGVVLGLVAGVLVLVQGLLGGLRVVMADGSGDVDAWKDQARETVYTGDATQNDFALTVDQATSLNLAAAHGVSGQLTFAALLVIAAMVAPRWLNCSPSSCAMQRDDGFLRTAAYLLFGGAVLQLILGSLTRHHESLMTLMLHASLGTLVVLVSAIAGFRASSSHRDTPTLHRLGTVLIGVVVLQFLLGWVATFYNAPLYDGVREGEPGGFVVLSATAHQALGAVFLGNVALLGAWAFRLARVPAGAGVVRETSDRGATGVVATPQSA